MPLKVTDVKIFLVDSGTNRNWLFVRVDTNEGIRGWGEAFTARYRAKAIASYINDIKQPLIGRSPFNIKQFTWAMIHDFIFRSGSLELYCAISSIEMALWDIVGKCYNAPVYNLLGGASRDKVRVYASGWDIDARTPQEYARKAVETLGKGVNALKFAPFGGPHQTYVSREEEKAAVQVVRAIREAVGENVDLAIDVGGRFSPMYAIRFAHMIEEFKPFFYEEPVAPDNIGALAEVRRKVHMPIMTGETFCTKSDFQKLFEKRAADIINPEVCCTGLLELKDIAAMAEPYYIAEVKQLISLFESILMFISPDDTRTGNSVCSIFTSPPQSAWPFLQ